MGHVTVVGGCRAKAPSAGILASTLPVGSVVKLMENGTAVEYLVVNQGIPSNSSLYDASCDGTWLLRKDVVAGHTWNNGGENTYASSAINTWLNGDFFNSLGAIEQTAVKLVKIPYCIGNGSAIVNNGANGLSVKAFLLSGYEVGGIADSKLPVDGSKLDYFISGNGADACNMRIAYYDGRANPWQLRSPRTDTAQNIWYVGINGYYDYSSGTGAGQHRPALILPKTALFDETTMLLKGVA